MKEIKLFDYQEDMKERIEKALRLHRSVMAQMPTGTGKTVLTCFGRRIVFEGNIPIAMFGLLPIEGSWFLRFEKLLKEFFRKSPRPLFTLKGSVPPLTQAPLPSGERGGTAYWCSEPLRSKVGGPSKVSPDCC